ncbi:MAG: ABC transporter substrate-binding protein, partial [Athalassotoga sp.]
MKKVGVVLVVSMLFLGMLMFGENVKYGGVVNIGGSAPDSVAANFNPFSPNADQVLGFVYEPLMYINSLNGSITPMLATSYKWEDNNLKMVVTIRKDVKWNDGVPFTPEDVTFTFNLLKSYPA